MDTNSVAIEQRFGHEREHGAREDAGGSVEINPAGVVIPCADGFKRRPGAVWVARVDQETGGGSRQGRVGRVPASNQRNVKPQVVFDFLGQEADKVGVAGKLCLVAGKVLAETAAPPT